MQSTTANQVILKMKEFYTTGAHSDLTLICGGKEFKVHKLTFDATSPVLRRFVTGQFKEAQENKGILELHDDDPVAVESLLHFLYNYTYSDSMLKEGSTLLFAVKIYAIADKYEIKELQELAAAKFKAKFVLQENLFNLEEVMDAIVLVDTTTNPNDPTLWNIILEIVRDHMHELLENATFKEFVYEMKVFNFKLLSLVKPAGSTQRHSTMGSLTFDMIAGVGSMASPHRGGRRLG